MNYEYTIIDSCHIANSEWRRRRPKSVYAESPVVKLEKRIGGFGDRAFCVSHTRPWKRDGKTAVLRDCDHGSESSARPDFNRFCNTFFPWRTIPSDETPKRLDVCTQTHAGIRHGIEFTRDPTDGFCVQRFVYRHTSDLTTKRKVRRRHGHRDCYRAKEQALETFKSWCGTDMKQRQVLA